MWWRHLAKPLCQWLSATETILNSLLFSLFSVTFSRHFSCRLPLLPPVLSPFRHISHAKTWDLLQLKFSANIKSSSLHDKRQFRWNFHISFLDSLRFTSLFYAWQDKHERTHTQTHTKACFIHKIGSQSTVLERQATFRMLFFVRHFSDFIYSSHSILLAKNNKIEL